MAGKEKWEEEEEEGKLCRVKAEADGVVYIGIRGGQQSKTHTERSRLLV